jgi:transcriptional regulator with XRE-family HTH domain
MRKKIKDRAAELRAELATLRESRERQKIVQVELAAELGIGQEGVSRLERRNDALVSTIRKAVEAMGGDLHIIAEFPQRGRVELSGFGEATELKHGAG